MEREEKHWRAAEGHVVCPFPMKAKLVTGVRSSSDSGPQPSIMDWDDYFREQSTMYCELVQKTEDAFIKQELLELAAVCAEVPNNIERIISPAANDLCRTR